MLKQRFGKKGFTMAELLIVIAIIAILIAIALPVFGAQLDKARAAVELANVRSAYSEAVANALLDGTAPAGELDPASEVEIKMEDLVKALKFSDTTSIEYTAAVPEVKDGDGNVTTEAVPATIKVTYKGHYGTFTIDNDVKVTGNNWTHTAAGGAGGAG